jgi:myo-inositol-1(or 4)-monophosphatase
MKRSEKTAFLEFAIKLAKSSGKITLGDFRKVTKYERKKDGTLVTETDIKVDRHIIGKIRAKYPGHSILTEESEAFEGSSVYTWIIDPLDGTHNFIHGIPIFSVSIALARKDEVILGAIYFPFLDWTFYAERGKGAFMGDRRIHVSARGEDNALAMHDSYFVGKKDSQIRSIDKLAGAVKRLRLFGAATMGFVSVASGMADVYVERSDKPHDIAAGCVIAEEAGATVTEISGKKWSLRSCDLVVSNGKFHRKLLEIYNK